MCLYNCATWLPLRLSYKGTPTTPDLPKSYAMWARVFRSRYPCCTTARCSRLQSTRRPYIRRNTHVYCPARRIARLVPQKQFRFGYTFRRDRALQRVGKHKLHHNARWIARPSAHIHYRRATSVSWVPYTQFQYTAYAEKCQVIWNAYREVRCRCRQTGFPVLMSNHGVLYYVMETLGFRRVILRENAIVFGITQSIIRCCKDKITWKNDIWYNHGIIFIFI